MVELSPPEKSLPPQHDSKYGHQTLRFYNVVHNRGDIMVTSRLGKHSLLLAALLFGTVSTASAEYPDKPIRFIVPFSTGGGTDLQGRIIAENLHQGLGQTVLVENRTGAGGLIGAEAVAKAAPDGYMVLMTTASISLNAVLKKNSMHFDLLKDLDPVTWVSNTALVLAIHDSVPARSV